MEGRCCWVGWLGGGVCSLEGLAVLRVVRFGLGVEVGLVVLDGFGALAGGGCCSSSSWVGFFLVNDERKDDMVEEVDED